MIYFAIPTADTFRRRHACLRDEGETGGSPCQKLELCFVRNGRSGSSVFFVADQMPDDASFVDRETCCIFSLSPAWNMVMFRCWRCCAVKSVESQSRYGMEVYKREPNS